MAANPCCVRAIPYENSDGCKKKSISMCLYVHTGGQGIQNDLKQATEEIFSDYQVEFIDLQRRPLCKVKRLSSNEKKKDKELSDLAKIIEENLNIFENLLNVTAVQPSYKIIHYNETATPCVTVYVLGKGRFPLGEKKFSDIVRLTGNIPFDVIEGYYHPSSSFESSVWPLHGGVSIAPKKLPDVEGLPGVGTLGGFLKDDAGKCYLLSCEHVLHPEGDLQVSDVIVQPSEQDFEIKYAQVQEEIENENSQIAKVKEKLAYVKGEKDKEDNYKRTITKRENKLKTHERDLNDLDNNRPRGIGMYLLGLQSNELVTYSGGNSNSNKKIFVDAGIAEMEEEEVNQMKLEKEIEENCCNIYGFNHMKKTVLIAPTGEIVKWTEFNTESKKEQLRFMKCGRTTGITTDGQIDTPMHLNIGGFKADTYFGKLTVHPFKVYCRTCVPKKDDDKNIIETSCLKEQDCAKCSNKIEKNDKVSELWACNCLPLRQKSGSFAKKGDSGSIIFDDQGRAWSVLFGIFETSYDLISLTAPLDVTIQTLENKLGKKLHLWQVDKI